MLVSEYETLIVCRWFNINSHHGMTENCVFAFVSSNLVTQRFVLRHPERRLMNVIIFFGGDRGIAEGDHGSRLEIAGSRIAFLQSLQRGVLKMIFVQSRLRRCDDLFAGNLQIYVS